MLCWVVPTDAAVRLMLVSRKWWNAVKWLWDGEEARTEEQRDGCRMAEKEDIRSREVKEGKKMMSLLIFLMRFLDRYVLDLEFISVWSLISTSKIQRKTNEKGLKTLSFNNNDKIKGKVNSTMFDILV